VQEHQHHRACGAADGDRRDRALAATLGRSAADGDAAGRLDPGIAAGSLLTGYIPERVLRPILAAGLILAGAKLITG